MAVLLMRFQNLKMRKSLFLMACELPVIAFFIAGPTLGFGINQPKKMIQTQ